MNLSSISSEQLMSTARIIMNETRLQTDPPMQKFARMQEIYLSENAHLYTTKQLYQIRQWLRAVQYKFIVAHVHGEELWTLSMANRWSLLDLLEQSTEKQQWTDNDLMIGSMYLENFLLQGRSFLNIYLFYVCLLMNITDPGLITVEKFNKQMQTVKGERFEQRAHIIQAYFETVVLGPGKWGALIKALRDKITHRENLRPSHQGNEIISGILLDWPTIQGMTFEHFVQGFANGMFEMIRATAPTLFELEWKAGPYRADLWPLPHPPAS